VDVEGIERATVRAVAPARVLEIDGWLAALDRGTIRRASSAVPLRHDADPTALDAIEAAYRAENLTPAFRIADAPALQPVRAALGARGYASEQPTLVKIGDAARLAALHSTPGDRLDRPDAGWAAVFMGEGFDPADGANRVAALSRSPDAVYGAVRVAGVTVAVGVATFAPGWAGVHGMRTALDHRGRGHASQVLAALGCAIQARGLDRVFLQVEETNPARSLYRKAGFSQAWRYHYWSR